VASAEEVRAAHDRYLAVRGQAERGEVRWSELARFFTDDATFIDPAWGRVEGTAAIREFLDDSMTGLEGWSFPQDFYLVDGDRIVTRWMNRLPGQRDDGSYYEAPGISLILYAGDGKFRYEEDLLNMVHVMELIRESGWKPGPGAKPPPHPPRR